MGTDVGDVEIEVGGHLHKEKWTLVGTAEAPQPLQDRSLYACGVWVLRL